MTAGITSLLLFNIEGTFFIKKLLYTLTCAVERLSLVQLPKDDSSGLIVCPSI